MSSVDTRRVFRIGLCAFYLFERGVANKQPIWASDIADGEITLEPTFAEYKAGCPITLQDKRLVEINAKLKVVLGNTSLRILNTAFGGDLTETLGAGAATVTSQPNIIEEIGTSIKSTIVSSVVTTAANVILADWFICATAASTLVWINSKTGEQFTTVLVGADVITVIPGVTVTFAAGPFAFVVGDTIQIQSRPNFTDYRGQLIVGSSGPGVYKARVKAQWYNAGGSIAKESWINIPQLQAEGPTFPVTSAEHSKLEWSGSILFSNPVFEPNQEFYGLFKIEDYN